MSQVVGETSKEIRTQVFDCHTLVKGRVWKHLVIGPHGFPVCGEEVIEVIQCTSFLVLLGVFVIVKDIAVGLPCTYLINQVYQENLVISHAVFVLIVLVGYLLLMLFQLINFIVPSWSHGGARLEWWMMVWKKVVPVSIK